MGSGGTKGAVSGKSETKQLILNIDDFPMTDIDDKINSASSSSSILFTKERGRYIEVMEPADDGQKQFRVVGALPEYNRCILVDRRRDELWPSNYCELCHFV